MRKRLIPLFVAFLALFVIFSQSAWGSPDQFTITNADAAVYISTAGSPQLKTLFADVRPRFVVGMANSLRYYDLPPVPQALLDLTRQVEPRFAIQFANSNRFLPLSYPAALIGDTLPPKIIQFTASSAGIITCVTDEYTQAEISYGTSSGNYTLHITLPDYASSRQVRLPDLIDGATYYYQMIVTDRTGNTVESQENSFKFQAPPPIRNLYLPLTVKKR